jgi:tRNA (guanine37-N1)-methyltransferase
MSTRSIDVLTLFPEYFGWLVESRPIRNLVGEGVLELGVHDMRPFSPLKNHQVDDTPYGGGAGMVLRVDVVALALEGIYGESLEEIRATRRVVVLTPAGRRFDDGIAGEWATDARPITLLCGRYEGFDHRVHDHIATEELSIGPYVLSGGEPAAMTVIDAVTRKIPGALGNPDSLVDETFSEGLDGGSEYPHYTRPPEYRGWEVPDILLSGNHGKVDAWRREQSLGRTRD